LLIPGRGKPLAAPSRRLFLPPVSGAYPSNPPFFPL
jgi:hypothetical protein